MAKTVETITVKNSCPFCGRVGELKVPLKSYMEWEFGELIQKAFPDFSTEDREFLKTGMCRQCQKQFDEQEDSE